MSKIRFGLAALDAIQKNYEVFLQRLINGYKKITGKEPEGLELTMIKREAYEKAEESAKVVDMAGKTLDPAKPIMGGTQQVEKTSRKLTDEEYFELVDEYGEGVPYPMETVADKNKFLKEQKDYEAEMFQEYKMGKLDPQPGEVSRSRLNYLKNKLEEMEMSGDKKLISPDEIEELSDLEKRFEYRDLVEKVQDVNRKLSTEEINRLKELDDMGFEDVLTEIDRDKKADGGRINFALGGPSNIIGAGLSDPGLGLLGGMEEEEDEFAGIQGQTAGLGVLSGLTKILGPKVGAYVFKRGRDAVVNEGLEIAQRATQARRQAAEAAAATIAAMAQANRLQGTGGYQAGYSSDFMEGPAGGYDNTPSGIAAATANMGSFAEGGLASMFVERR